MTDKKNQHYIPKFYLRNFSYRGNLKQIGLFNVKSNFFYQTAPLKNQGSKDFFYGNDGVIEEGLSIIEGRLAQTIKNIIADKVLPKAFSKEHLSLLMFVGLTDLRNPIVIEIYKSMFKTVEAKLKELNIYTDTQDFFPEIEHRQAVNTSLKGLNDVVGYMGDLGYKLLINKTSTPFISSDFPIVKYNQYLEGKNWKNHKTGYGTTGLQLIVPLSNEMVIILYDSAIYKVGAKRSQCLEIDKIEDVNQLNMLQLLNCFQTVYFNETINEHYINELAKKTSKFNRPNQLESEVFFKIMSEEEKEKGGKDNLIITGSSELAIKLKIAGISIHSSGKKHQLSETLAQVRPVPMQLRNEKRNRD